MQRYKILSLNAIDIINDAMLERNESNRYHYLINVSKQAEKLANIRGDNALFFQIRQVCKETEDDLMALYKHIIILDYSSVIKEFNGTDPSEIIKVINEGPTPNSIEDHLNHLLNPSNIIELKFDDEKEPVLFSAFDKSTNMSKKSRIMYIEHSIKKDLDKRLCLDIPFCDIEMYLSKYYAYKGLYLTTATRVGTSKYFKLNEETVIVIEDKEFQTNNEHISPEFKKKYGVQDEYNFLVNVTDDKDLAAGAPHNFQIRQMVQKVNAFDGEGLISPEYAKYINRQIYDKQNATSFQVRMPFIKGMLHNVDFKRFVREDSYIDDDNPKIIDVFKIERELSKVQIILTKSMFKACNWLGTYWKDIKKCPIDKAHDPMKYFFDKVNEYNHSLYVSGSNLYYPSDGQDILNYQFLDTINMSSSDFVKLIEEHYENGEEQIRRTFAPENPSDTPKDTPSCLIAAACKNKMFYKEPQLQRMARAAVTKLGIDCGRGRLQTQGATCYLSGDLLYFLLHVASLCREAGSKTTDQSTWANRETLMDRFYMPNSPFPLIEGQYYAILRSPHLSREEECVLCPHTEGDENDQYKKYFGHLKGLIMVPATPPIQMLLGGSDFDGDIIRVYSNPLIVNAIRSSVYKDGTRILPIVKIPEEDGEKNKISDRKYVELIIHTFSSLTGKLSNLAVRFADTECKYTQEQYNGAIINNSALACAVVGLEIDSVKKGRKPLADIELLKEKAKYISKNGQTASDIFLNNKDKIAALKNKNFEIVLKNGNYIILPEGNNRIVINKPTSDDHNIVYLGYKFAEYEDKCKRKNYIFTRRIIPEPPTDGKYFDFEVKDFSEKPFTEEQSNKTIALIKAYVHILNNITSYQKGRNESKAEYLAYYRKLVNGLKIRYDDIEGPNNSGFEKSILLTLKQGLNILVHKLSTIELSNDALKRFKECNWIYTKNDDKLETKKSVLGKILGFSLSELPKDFITLLCDFSNDGFMTLYFCLQYTQSLNTYHASFEEICKNKHWPKEDCYGYYKKLQTIFSEQADIQIDDDIDIFDDMDSDDYDNSNWKPALQDETRCILWKIAGSRTGKNPSESIKYRALKYVHKQRQMYDSNGTFFWDILPAKLILNHIYTEGSDNNVK